MYTFSSKLLLVSILLISVLNYSSSQSNDICDPNVKIQNWPIEKITSNTKLDTKNENIKFVQSNATTIEECTQQCCSIPDCNVAFYKDMLECYLISCTNNQECTPMPNHRKIQTDPIDYLIKIRPIEVEELEKKESKALDQTAHCTANTSLTDCPPNELCLMGQCVCPKEFSFIRVDNICREYLKKSPGCSMFMNECNPGLNEECVAINNYARHGSCQCKLGLKRNLQTSMCEEFIIRETSDETKHNKRKRPTDLKMNIDPSDELLNEIIKGLEAEKNSDDDKLKITDTLNEMKSQTPLTDQTTLSTSTTSTTTTLTTTTKETTTEPVKITTNNLIAFAGNDIHVYYPSTMVILDGSLTRYYGTDGIDGIVKWVWIKHESSPAFGKFHQTNEKPIVIYEQLVEGDYKFILKVWTNTNEFSLDTVHVYVHSHLNKSESNKNRIAESHLQTNQSLVNENQFINENLIQLELDFEPKLFSESNKNEFISKLEILLQQYSLKNPKVILINTGVSMKARKSRVLLDLLVCEEVDKLEPKTEEVFDFDYLNKLSQDFHLGPHAELSSPFLRVLKTSETIKLLKMNQKIYSFKIPFVNFLNLNSKNEIPEFLGLRITEIGQLKCDSNKYSLSFNCSNHGYCDTLSGRCVCNKYWMSNLYRFYFRNENDLTNGNNCEWNIPLFAILATIFLVLLTIVCGTVFKFTIYYFFYICCCFCCCGQSKKKSNKMNDDFKKNKMKKYNKFDLYLEEKLNEHNSDDDDEEFNEEMNKKLLSYKKSALNKLKSKFRSVPSLHGKKNVHKYSLLNDEDETRLLKSKKRTGEPDRMGAKLNLDEMEARRGEDDDEEDVVFEQSYSTTPEAALTNSATKQKKFFKKPDDYKIKEYKQIV